MALRTHDRFTRIGQTTEAGPQPPSAEIVNHISGASSSHFSPYNFIPTWEGMKLTAQRFLAGNAKHEKNNPVYLEANWLQAFHARDVGFFRDRAGHAMEHLIAEMRGDDDFDPGGNLGGLGWFQDVMAYVKKNDPDFYGAIQGKWRVEDLDPLIIPVPKTYQEAKDGPSNR